ncbi:cytochrome P450 [Mycobacterium paraseoulense]|nr:cytochrome P450 [Mycobacterium paraseoulense]
MAADRKIGWDHLRSMGRVVLIDGWYYLTHRDDVLGALRRPELFSSKDAFEILGSPVPLPPLSTDPPEHTRYRKILQPFFSPGALKEMLKSLRLQAAEIVDAAVQSGQCDAISSIAIPYPSQVFLTLFGLPIEDRDRLIAWKDAVINLTERASLEGADLTPALELFAYVQQALEDTRKSPNDGMLSQLLTGEERLDDTELMGFCYLFVLAGLDTVTATIGFALLELARDKRLQDRIRQNPEDTVPFVEEIVRLEPTVAMLLRVTTESVRVGDVTLPAGTPVRLCVGAVNRDSSDGTSTNDLVMDGKIHRHWGFGGGAHRCLGSHLARIELAAVIDSILEKTKNISLAKDYTPCIKFPANAFQLGELPLIMEA